MIEGFNKDKCLRRNRIAAVRGKVESSTFRVAASLSGAIVTATGEVPEGEAALAKINALLPAGVNPLTLDQVWILPPMEAANSNLIPDRFGFFATSTLANIASDGAKGIAFMNSHRTGDISTPAELPFGKTFAGRYEAVVGDDGKVFERAVLGVYMLRGIRPNGSDGPSTDDLYRMITGGQVNDVSVGLFRGTAGQAICNVCGEDYLGYDCDHYAGTTEYMSDDQIQEQTNAGIPSGKASYTLHDYELSEVSGVYDGAVPGAGFAKGLAAFTQLSPEGREQFRELFRDLLDESISPPEERTQKPAQPAGTSTPGVTQTTTARATAGKEGLMPLTAAQVRAEHPEAAAEIAADAAGSERTRIAGILQLNTQANRAVAAKEIDAAIEDPTATSGDLAVKILNAQTKRREAIATSRQADADEAAIDDPEVPDSTDRREAHASKPIDARSIYQKRAEGLRGGK